MKLLTPPSLSLTLACSVMYSINYTWRFTGIEGETNKGQKCVCAWLWSHAACGQGPPKAFVSSVYFTLSPSLTANNQVLFQPFWICTRANYAINRFKSVFWLLTARGTQGKKEKVCVCVWKRQIILAGLLFTLFLYYIFLNKSVFSKPNREIWNSSTDLW